MLRDTISKQTKKHMRMQWLPAWFVLVIGTCLPAAVSAEDFVSPAEVPTIDEVLKTQPTPKTIEPEEPARVFDRPCSYYQSEIVRIKKLRLGLIAAYRRQGTSSLLGQIQAAEAALETAVETSDECILAAQPAGEQLDKLARSTSSRSFMWSGRICAFRRFLSYLSKDNTRRIERGLAGEVMGSSLREETSLRQSIAAAEATVRAQKLKLWNCADSRIQLLRPCLDSLTELSLPIRAYLGNDLKYCRTMPYLAAKRADVAEPAMTLAE